MFIVLTYLQPPLEIQCSRTGKPPFFFFFFLSSYRLLVLLPPTGANISCTHFQMLYGTLSLSLPPECLYASYSSHSFNTSFDPYVLLLVFRSVLPVLLHLSVLFYIDVFPCQILLFLLLLLLFGKQLIGYLAWNRCCIFLEGPVPEVFLEQYSQ